MTNNDYSAFAEAAPSAEGLADLSTTAIELYQATLEVALREEELKAAKKKVADLSEHVIPELMDEAGVAELKLANGTTLKVKDMLTIGSVTKKPEVLAWLEETGNSALIKRSLSVSLGKNADEAEAKIVKDLAEEGFSDVTALREVHAQTLKAHVKRLLEEGGDVDMDLLQVRQFKRAEITGKPKDGSSAFGE